MSGLNQLAEGGGKLLSAVPNIYDDLAKPAVQQAGKILSFPLEVINALLVRPRSWIANANYKLQETNVLIAKKLENISADKIKAPEDYIAVPTLQALSYSMESQELREMYANLLAKAMYSETADDVMPAYVEIIKQLSPTDIRCFEEIFNNKGKISYKNTFVKNVLTGNGYSVLPYISEFDFTDLNTINCSIDNLFRLGLLSDVTLPPNWEFNNNIDSNAYGIKHIKNITENLLKENEIIEYEYKTLCSSTLGALFHAVCCEDIK